MLHVFVLALALLHVREAAPEPKVGVVVPLSFAIDDTWNDVAKPIARLTDGTRSWRHRRTKAMLTLRLSAYGERTPDDAFEEKLGELRLKKLMGDLKFYPNAIVLRWTDHARRGFACARAFPDADGPLTIEVIGRWPTKHDATMAEDALRLCRETTFSIDADK